MRLGGAMGDVPTAGGSTVDLLWIPLGAGAQVVRWSGRLFEAVMALVQRRPRHALYHSALVVTLPVGAVAIEMTPRPDLDGDTRGVVGDGAVGSAWLGRFRVFRYEIRRWPGGEIPDAGAAVGGPRRVSGDRLVGERLLDLVAAVPTPVWGRDELGAGEMWNSNSVTSWLLAAAGIDVAALSPPAGGRAPGWDAGTVVAERSLAAVRVGAARGRRTPRQCVPLR